MSSKTLRIRLPIRNLLTFYDAPNKGVGGHVSAITGVIGEDLGAGLLIDYFRRRGIQAEVIGSRVTQGTNIGKRLDRWILVTKRNRSICYQVEIKNWGASAIGGRRIELDASAATLRRHKIERWGREWNGKDFIKEGVKKVLTLMRSPISGISVEPMVIFWDAMHPTGANTPLFSVQLISKVFSRVWIFSMSSYLRKLFKAGVREIEFEAPAIKARMQMLKELLGS